MGLVYGARTEISPIKLFSSLGPSRTIGGPFRHLWVFFELNGLLKKNSYMGLIPTFMGPEPK